LTETLPAGKDPATGRFTTGNRFWEARSSHGRTPKYETAEMLEDAIRQYFEWNEANPLYEGKLVTFQGQSTVEPVPKLRAMTMVGMCMYIGVTRETWSEWRQSRPDFSDTIAWAEGVIYRQKFEGASADLLNPNIIARDLGLAEKKEHTSPDGSMSPKPALDVSKLSTAALAEIMSAVDASSRPSDD
jgi:hypothetical protein